MMQQSQVDKEVSISITKIFNWPGSESKNDQFQLVFYPELTDWEPIIQKSVIGSFASNSMVLNAHLKISYTEEQKIVLLKLLNLGNILGEFPIDLDLLKDKRVQYFTFGTNQVLQINIYTPVKPNQVTMNRGAKIVQNPGQSSRVKNMSQINTPLSTFHPSQQQARGDDLNVQRRINERISLQMNYNEEGYGDVEYTSKIYRENQYNGQTRGRSKHHLSPRYYNDEERSNRSRLTYRDEEDNSVRGGLRAPTRYSNYGNNMHPSSSRSRQDPKMGRKSFSQKVLCLLQQVKMIKSQLSASRTGLAPGLTNPVQENNNNLNKLKKSVSQTHLLRTKPGVGSSTGNHFHQNGKNTPSNINGQGQKHRLLLDSLNVVPYDEYYDANRNKISGHSPRLVNSHTLRYQDNNYQIRSSAR